MKNSKFYSKNIKKETNNSGNIGNKTDNLKNIIAPSYMGGVVSNKFNKKSPHLGLKKINCDDIMEKFKKCQDTSEKTKKRSKTIFPSYVSRAELPFKYHNHIRNIPHNVINIINWNEYDLFQNWHFK